MSAVESHNLVKTTIYEVMGFYCIIFVYSVSFVDSYFCGQRSLASPANSLFIFLFILCLLWTKEKLILPREKSHSFLFILCLLWTLTFVDSRHCAP